MTKIEQLVDKMDPEEAASEITSIMKKLFPLVSEETRLKFVAGLAGDPGGDRVTSMVHF
jgi:hypothetical protein